MNNLPHAYPNPFSALSIRMTDEVKQMFTEFFFFSVSTAVSMGKIHDSMDAINESCNNLAGKAFTTRSRYKALPLWKNPPFYQNLQRHTTCNFPSIFCQSFPSKLVREYLSSLIFYYLGS